MVSPHYKLPKQIFVASELAPISDEVFTLAGYSFQVERETIADVASARQLQLQAEEAFAKRKKAYEEEKLKKQKVAARKIAPGFLDTDTRILTPQQLYHSQTDKNEESENTGTRTESVPVSPQLSHSQQPSPASTEKPSPSTNNEINSKQPLDNPSTSQASAAAATAFDYLRFEQGLAPPDPWDTPENDLLALKSILGNAANKTNNRPVSASPDQYNYNKSATDQFTKSHGMFPSTPRRPHSTQQTSTPDTGYWAFKNNPPPHGSKHNYNPQPMPGIGRHSSAPVAPALPPKLFKDGGSPSSSSPHPSMSVPPLPSQPTSSPLPTSLPDYRTTSGSASPVIPPPLPPLPPTRSPKESLVQELINMGFSRVQAVEALEKNDNDLIKATNFLLDHEVA
ncbi:uncharacterized protein BYT42DRAFT_571789 [Radiomyces spectabilis]|uniref:uncharacterized protein n=1 Tax=Radiomyces spectabilis TaxID=64574 RepID=UPI002220796D|nr:uncharacterized protein BYT42DRAFT_571789 [Radiomyces spectabilis]KAI8377813.1 hypothetical protein BYT42DRAFT_571789 [Radiomyces spectabilis]